MQKENPESLNALTRKIAFEPAERNLWQRAADDMYIPFGEKLGIHKQDDSFLHLDPVDMRKLPLHVDLRADRHPLNLWRMQVAKQADVVLLMLVLGDQFGQDVKRANYEFYEPRTNHGSSLSTSIHSILASEIGRHEDAYEYFRHSAFMDLHDFKNNAAGGVHSACLGGTWMAVINGFAGLRDYEDALLFNPVLPAAWKGYRFRLAYRGRRIEVDVSGHEVTYTLLAGDPVTFTSSGTKITLTPAKPVARAKLASSIAIARKG
jgi:alpha,alpha-trehalose phosphorylase